MVDGFNFFNWQVTSLFVKNIKVNLNV